MAPREYGTTLCTTSTIMTTSKPRVVLLTGCSTGGIGHSLYVSLPTVVNGFAKNVAFRVGRSEEFAQNGCVVYATSRNLDTIGPFKANSIHRLALNVNSDESVQSVFKHIMREEGRIDIVVNNAGVTNPGLYWSISSAPVSTYKYVLDLILGPLVEVSIQAIKEVYETNVFALLRVTKAAVPIMAKQNSGTIVNIGSIVGDMSVSCEPISPVFIQLTYTHIAVERHGAAFTLPPKPQ